MTFARWPSFAAPATQLSAADAKATVADKATLASDLAAKLVETPAALEVYGGDASALASIHVGARPADAPAERWKAGRGGDRGPSTGWIQIWKSRPPQAVSAFDAVYLDIIREVSK